MVKFLERPEAPQSFSDKLMKGLSTTTQNIPEMLIGFNKKKQSEQLADLIGIPKDKREAFSSLPPEWQKTYASMVQKERGSLEKNLAGSRKYLKGAIPEDLSLHLDDIDPIYQNYLREGLSPSEARDRAIADIRSQEPQESEGEPTGVFGLGGVLGSPLLEKLTMPSGERHPSGAIPLSEKGLGERFKEVAKATPYALASALENFGPLTPLLKLAQQKTEMPSVEELLANKTPLKREKYFETPSEKLGEKLTPEERETGDVLSIVGSLVSPALLSKLKRFLPKGPIEPSEIIPAEKAKQLAHKPGMPPGEEMPSAPSPKEPSLEGKVAKAPDTPTEMRVERLQPEKRIYPRLQNVELREKQLKLHPKYVEEIAVDAAERAERAEKRVPKTVKGMDAQRLRVHEAEKAYPPALESYNRSIARVRAIEDEVVNLRGQAKESAETLLELAKKDLEDATFNLKNAWENLEGTNYRATADEMRAAARKKMIEIQETLAGDQEYEIAKRDYSPDLIKKAKEYSKLKPLPKARQSDFYTQVHDVYINEYKNRLAELDKELHALPKTMAGLGHGRLLQKEKEILSKMIQSAEAEKTIQNRRFGLREMAERHKAHERFKKLEKAEGKPEHGKVAQERMWKSRISEAKTPQERAKVIGEGVEQIAAENPKQAERIRVEGEKLKESVEDLFKKKPPEEMPSSGGQKPPPKPPKPPEAPLPSGEEMFKGRTANDAVKKGKKHFEKFAADIRALRDSFPYIWHTSLGRDLIAGVGVAAFDEFLAKDLDLPFTASAVVSATLGRGRAGTRVISNMATKWAIRKWRLGEAEDAFRKKDAKKFKSYTPSIQKAAKNRVYGT